MFCLRDGFSVIDKIIRYTAKRVPIGSISILGEISLFGELTIE